MPKLVHFSAALDNFGEREFSVGLELEIESLVSRGLGIELAPLIGRMPSTFPKPKAWSAALRRALVPVSTQDAELVVKELGASGAPNDAVATYTAPGVRPAGVVDPDPLFFALEVLVQVLGPLGGAVSVYRSASGLLRERRVDRAAVMRHLYSADRALSRIDQVYRSLVSIFGEADVLEGQIAPGTPLVISTEVSRELDGLRQEVFRAGTALNRALTSLSAHIGRSESDAAIELSHALHAAFERTRESRTIADFLAETGEVIQLASDYIARVGQAYGFQPVTVRTELLQEAIHRLRLRQ